MSNPNHCIYCNAPLNRPDAKFCARCGHAQNLFQSAVNSNITRTVTHDATLLIQDGGQSNIVPLDDNPLTIGRATDNSIILNSRFVSGRHARIEPEGIAHRIIDVGSMNGLLYEGHRVQQHSLADGDVLRIGDPTTGNFVSLTYHNRFAIRVPQSAQIAHSYPLNPNDPQITLGRFGCEVILDNPQVSRFHAQIDRLPDNRHLLRDAGSTNATFVNGKRISQHSLNPGDIIQIGPFKLVYNITSLDQYDQRGALRLDARKLSHQIRRNDQTLFILHNISLSIAPREFVALVGSSGAGKSTLLKALCGYAHASSGQVLVNGDDYYNNFDAYRTMLGYVPQEDIIHRGLPLGQALEYAAQLRLPADTAESEIAQRIKRVLDDVEMGVQRDQVVESLSGGQRKRVNIGVELLADPSLFFLDEPTSGLDPGLEKKMMYTLRRLADSGRTVVLITHATANIMQCDHIVFMSNGRMVFFGPPSDALTFFGVASEDFADIYTKLEGLADPQSIIVQRYLNDEYTMWQQTNAAKPTTQNPNTQPALAELWETKYRHSSYYQKYVADRLAEIPPGPIVAPNETGARRQTRRVSLLRQFGILSRRYLDIMLQDRRNLLILFLQAPIIALLLLIVARSDTLVGVQAQGLLQRGEAKKLLFMIATVSVWFGIINAAREITKEIPIFRRERLVNLQIGPYIGSKVAVLSLLVLLQSIILLLVLGVKVIYPNDTGLLLPTMLELLITTVLTAMAGMALGLVISSASSTPDRAISIVPLVLIPQIVFAGLIFHIEGFATPLSWLTISRWSMEALGTSINLNALCNMPNIDNQNSIPPGCSPNFLEIETAFTYNASYLLSRWAILALYMLVCLGLTAWLLKRRERDL
ncbi:MAG: FHA domain-containing protein [Chloroflexales bacterium]|nr:FHA domain-containing protein [Chloroflexales bacterium]